jgi:hypothetical protein
MVNPREDDFIRDYKSFDLILPQTTRAKMMCDDDRMPARARIEKPNTHYPLWQTMDTLRAQGELFKIRVRFIQLLSAEVDLDLDGRTRVWPVGFDGILVNTYGRRGMGAFTIESLNQDPWTALHALGDEVHRYQRMFANGKGSVQGFVRILTRGQNEKRSHISSSLVRKLAKTMSVQELAESELLRAVVLGWSILQQDKIWLDWIADRLNGCDATSSQQPRDILEKGLREAWELEGHDSYGD